MVVTAVKMASYASRMSSRQMGWLRHVLTVLSVIIFLLGCIVIGYMAWVLATSVTVSRFLEGSMFWTYAVITLGFSLFFSGLVGWVGGASESPCLVRLFLMFIVLSMLAEIGGIISLNIFDKGFGDILEHGWREVNQGTRNLVQKHLTCCGWEGLTDFANNNEPIDDSCYEKVTPSVSGIISRVDEEPNPGTTRRMKQSPCMDNLQAWFEENKITWVTILATVAAIQVMCVGIAIYILQRVSKLRKIRTSRTVSKRKLYDSSSEGSDDHKYMHRI